MADCEIAKDIWAPNSHHKFLRYTMYKSTETTLRDNHGCLSSILNLYTSACLFGVLVSYFKMWPHMTRYLYFRDSESASCQAMCCLKATKHAAFKISPFPHISPSSLLSSLDWLFRENLHWKAGNHGFSPSIWWGVPLKMSLKPSQCFNMRLSCKSYGF